MDKLWVNFNRVQVLEVYSLFTRIGIEFGPDRKPLSKL